MTAAPVAVPEDARSTDDIRADILTLVEEYCARVHGPRPFISGLSPVPISGRVFDATDVKSLVESALDFWLTTGRFNEAFQSKLAARVGVHYALTVNSGSSANLAAFFALTSPLVKERQLMPGDEVITAAAGFPTTVNPIILHGATPVFVDVDIPTYNVNPDDIEAAITRKTRAIVIAHTLGNPFDAPRVAEIATRHGLWLIEDCCDALGATVNGQHVGTFGDIGTLSFYPAHHITTGEGGAAFTKNALLRRAMEAFRDWGRDCYCDPGMENTCKKRFDWQLGDLPYGYDHKYIYSHLGFNLKMTDMQAAVGLAQLGHLDSFISARRRNFATLKDRLSDLEEFFILPEATANSEPSWFGFLLTVRDSAPFSRDDLIRHLNALGIGTRLLFGGNLTRQPYMQGRHYRIHGSLANSDRIMRRSLWLGVYPGLGEPEIEFIVNTIYAFCRDAATKRTVPTA